MVKYEVLGYTSQEEYKEDFFNNLLPTNHSFNYFVNWNKVFKNVKQYSIEISILNSLSKVDEEDLEVEFRKIINCYPEVVPLLPAILAIRFKSKNLTVDILEKTFKTYNFNDEEFDEDEIVTFSKKTGLLKLFTKINDLYAYLLGTEFGLYTNGRKNRSGTIFETLIEENINSLLDGTNYKIQSQGYVGGISRKKRADFIITDDDEQVLAIECNYYNATGSKPIEVTNAYIELQNEISNTNIKFLWITDGLGWNKMTSTILKGMENIDFIINYTMLENSIRKLLNIE